METARRIKALRREKDMTQADLAEKLKVSRASIANWETGIRSPDFNSIRIMSQLFGVPIDYFLGKTDYRYNIKYPDCFELDLTKLNSFGMDMLHEYYVYLISNDRFKEK
jgi:transcriptional regulator with XRE-family HTH domain